MGGRVLMDANAVHDAWNGRSGEYSPRYYAYYGPDATSDLVRGVLERFVPPDAAILELGCSSGRHLAHLYEGGYTNLSGIEINRDAADVMANTYPELAEAGTFYYDAIEAVLTEFADDQFDAVFSVETLQHIHHENAWVFEEVARITADLLVTVENEGDQSQPPADGSAVSYVNDAFPLYYRDWNAVFTAFGLNEVALEHLEEDTVRVFRLSQS